MTGRRVVTAFMFATAIGMMLVGGLAMAGTFSFDPTTAGIVGMSLVVAGALDMVLAGWLFARR
jgi:hypothetical protein